ncbi:hypothetical protein GIB67_002661 [Kingdonia uniflora]|uniref:Uncharacterized protein n=1 Tax=Kingdonia uniflora TaxID=39325 RepID=A0A7J7LJI8_9MAGN|nr:hypothetical protein GIB67_002661 [Kingdonia uniflora]
MMRNEDESLRNYLQFLNQHLPLSSLQIDLLGFLIERKNDNKWRRSLKAQHRRWC